MLKKYLDLILLTVMGVAVLWHNAIGTTPRVALPPSPAAAPAAARSAGGSGAALPIQQVETRDVDVMLVIDNSGSMSGGTCSKPQPAYGTDPNRNRIRAAEIVIASLAADIQPRQTKLGIVSFGNSAELIAELTQLSNEDATVRSALAQKIQDLPCAGDTNIVEAITVARQELQSERHRPGNTPIIIFLTDGKPTEGGDTDEIRRLMGGLEDVLFFAVLLGDASDFQPFKDFWHAMAATNPNLTVNDLRRSEDMPALYQQIKARIINTDHYLSPPFPPGATVDVPIPANVDQVVITVLKPTGSVEATLAQPDGRNAADLPADRFKLLDSNTSIEVFILKRPDPGNWKVASANGETLTVLRPEMQSIYEVQLVVPDQASSLLVDQPTDLAVRVIDRETRQPIQATFSISATYQAQGGPAVEFPLVASGGAEHAHQFAPQTFADGQRYRFQIAVRDAAGLGATPSSYEILASLQPAIAALAVPSQVFVDDKVSVILTIANPEAVKPGATIEIRNAPPNGGVVPMQAQDAATYQAQLPAMRDPGTYAIDIHVTGETNAGQPFAFRRTAQISVREHGSTIALRYALATLAGLILAYLVFRYVLLRPLIPVFQKIGLSPAGHIRITYPGAASAEPPIDLTRRLRDKRKLRRLSIGYGPGFDIRIQTADQPPAPDGQEPPKRRRGLGERMFGAKGEGQVGRHLRSETYLRNTRGGERTFRAASGHVAIADNEIEYSSQPLDN